MPRKVTPAPEGEAGFCVEGFPGTYDVVTAERISKLDDDGNVVESKPDEETAKPAKGEPGK